MGDIVILYFTMIANARKNGCNQERRKQDEMGSTDNATNSLLLVCRWDKLVEKGFLAERPDSGKHCTNASCRSSSTQSGCIN
jgi:hypothetical protein